ncbi:MAG: hypothetical protein PVG84_14245 [Desulfobacterales bacterium]|jgi:hypothetical protein
MKGDSKVGYKCVLMKRNEIISDEADDLFNASIKELLGLIDQVEIEGAENTCE